MSSSSQGLATGQSHGILILASQSPQRLSLLRQIGFDPLSLAANVDETALRGESARDLVLRLSGLKARSLEIHNIQQCIGDNQDDARIDGPDSVEDSDNIVVLGADTVIEIDGRILGKPLDKAEAIDMLHSLSGREHLVHTGVSIYEQCQKKTIETCVTTTVEFCELTPQIAKRYWQTGEPRNKAGGYAIQGMGAQFVIRLSGSYSNVVGLPLFETSQLLAQAGLTSLR